MPATAPQAPAHTYRRPYRPEGHPNQCYYGGSAARVRTHAAASVDDKSVEVFRFDHETHGARLTMDCACARIDFELPAAELLALRNALNDALIDIAAAQAKAERRAGLRAIMEELRDAELDGCSTGVYYAHPDVHYVADAAAAAAKAAALDAAGDGPYIVLVEPAMAATTEQVPA